MLSIATGQLDLWLAGLIFPLTRLLGLVAAAPPFSDRGVPLSVRLGLGLSVALALAPLLPAVPPPAGWLALAALTREAAIGAAMGFILRLVFAAVDLAGELIGLSMGLSFARFHDAQAGLGSPVPARFLTMLASLVLLGLDGHLMLVAVAARSFEWLPVAGGPLAAEGWAFVAHYGITVFAAGVMLALPLVATLLVTHLALGVLGRAAPQLNLFTAGFPVTVAVGLGVLPLVLQVFAPAFRGLLEQGLETVGQLLQALASG